MTTFALSSGLRMLLIRMCDTIPIEGRIAMYTSGCPKNQNRCCQSSGEPPEWGCRRSLTTNPAGIKKLVPATRSKINSRHVGSNTANASSAMQEVMNHAQVQIGIRASVMPLVRRSSVVAIKFKEPSREAMQKTKMDRPHRVWPSPSPGPASEPTALKGAYEVQPEIGGPSGTKNDTMLKRGKAMSSAPIWIGRK